MDTTAGQSDRLTAPPQDAMRRFIQSQTCPWCGEGPYKNLARHTNGAHGVAADELREMAGLIKKTPTCSPELSAGLAEQRAGKRLPESAYEWVRRPRRPPRKFSTAGLAAQKAALTTAVEVTVANRARKSAELVRQFGELGGTYTAVRALAKQEGVSTRSMAHRLRTTGADVPDARREQARKFSDIDVKTMRDLYENGVSQSEIGARFNIGQASVSRLLRRRAS